MAISRNKVAIGALTACLLAAGLPALGQQKTPESILPPGFDEPPPPPSPTPSPSVSPTPSGGTPGQSAGISGDTSSTDGNSSDDVPVGDTPDALPVDPALLARYETPDFARRSLAITGIIGVDQGGLPANAFGHTDGRYLEHLMARLDAPIASRWLSIALRRTLASRLSTPARVNGADFAAERAWLLVRMGEPIVARAVAQSVDPGNFTPKLYEATLQSALASADPAGLCGVADHARAVSRDRAWILASAFCLGLSGNPQAGEEAMAGVRRSGIATGVDQLLADKLLGSGASARQAVTIEWDNVDRLTVWRYGLATATGVAIPDALFGTANGRVQFWRAQAAMLDARARAPFAEMAAAQGIFSNAALVDLYGEVDAGDDQSSAEAGIARDLRTAYVDADPAVRVSTMQQLWNEPKDAAGRYARLVLTARAAARVAVADGAAASDDLIASMLSAGLEGAALRWKGSVKRGSPGWAMLSIIDGSGKRLTRADVGAFQSNGKGTTSEAVPIFFAALAGLDRLNPGDVADLARTMDIPLTLDNAWTRALDGAASRGQPGTVVLLAGIGMQTTDWHGVSPAALYRIIAAMHRVGLDNEARMIAVEALTRR